MADKTPLENILQTIDESIPDLKPTDSLKDVFYFIQTDDKSTGYCTLSKDRNDGLINQEKRMANTSNVKRDYMGFLEKADSFCTSIADFAKKDVSLRKYLSDTVSNLASDIKLAIDNLEGFYSTAGFLGVGDSYKTIVNKINNVISLVKQYKC